MGHLSDHWACSEPEWLDGPMTEKTETPVEAESKPNAKTFVPRKMRIKAIIAAWIPFSAKKVVIKESSTCIAISLDETLQ